MKRLPQGRYTPEFREEAVKLVTEGKLPPGQVSRRLSLPKSTLENWVRVAREGKLCEIGRGRKQLTEIEMELAITKMERDLLKKAATYFAKESLDGTR